MISYGYCDMTRPSSIRGIELLRFFRKSKARRALTELGTNDTKMNLKMAQEILTISAEQFAKKWNFDPVQMRPIDTGNYDWTQLRDNEIPKTSGLEKYVLETPQQNFENTESRIPRLPSSETEFKPIDSNSLEMHNFDGTLDSYFRQNYNSLASINTVLTCPVPRTPSKNKRTPNKQSPKYSTTPKSRQCKITG